MKWYWYVVIGVALLAIGFFAYKMFGKKANGHSHASTGTSTGTSNGNGNGDTGTGNGGDTGTGNGDTETPAEGGDNPAGRMAVAM